MLKRILLLGGPIIVGQLGLIAQQFADTMMVGHYATAHLAASGFINNIFNLATKRIMKCQNIYQKINQN